MHSYIASKGKLRVETHDGSDFVANHIPSSTTNLLILDRIFSAPPLCYLCKCALQIRTALHNTGKFGNYLNGVINVQQLIVYVKETNNLIPILKVDSDDFALFIQDALLMISVTEHVTNLKDEEWLDMISQVLTVMGNYVYLNYSQVVASHSFVSFANFMETMQLPQPINYTPQFNLMGIINADRFVRLLDTYRRGAYDLSDALKYLTSYENPLKIVPSLKLDNSVQFYLNNRIEEVPFLKRLKDGRHKFGSFLSSPAGSRESKILLAMEQVTYQLNYLFRTTSPTPFLKESILEGFSRLKYTALDERTRDYLDLWKFAFSCGLTDVVEFMVASENYICIYEEKLRLLKLYFRNDPKRMAAILELGKKAEKLTTTLQSN